MSIDGDGGVHRFFGQTNGRGVEEYHWSGSTSDARNPLGNSALGQEGRKILREKGVKIK